MPVVPLPTDQDGPPPLHVAIIMDGNGRWANARGKPRVAGHRAGAEAVRQAIETAADLGIKHLTLFSFSSENWRRPASEVSDLMGLLRLYLRKEVGSLMEQGARLIVVGERDRLAPDIVAAIEEAEQMTAGNVRITIVLAISYGGRAEIVEAARRLAKDVKDGRLDPAEIDETTFERSLMTYGIPDPDLLIRTSGEQRVSNFLLWQLAYTEFLFVDKHWPDFSAEDLRDAVREFSKRERRFGTSGG